MTQRIKSTIFLISVALFTLTITLFLTLSIYLLFFTPEPSNPRIKPKHYQYTETNPFDPEFEPRFGFMTLPSTLSLEQDDEFMTYLNEETGSTTIITPFQHTHTNYECTGFCLCDFEVHRTKTPLTIIFPADTDDLAKKIARKTMQDQCERQLSHICRPKQVSSQVKTCQIDYTTSTAVWKYDCKGFCSLNEEELKKEFFEEYEEVISAGENSIGKCEDLTLEKVEEVNSKPDRVLDVMVEDLFQGDLNEFCLSNSVVKSELLSKNLQEKIKENTEKKYENNPDDSPLFDLDALLSQESEEGRREWMESLNKEYLESVDEEKRRDHEGRSLCRGTNVKCVRMF